MKGLLHLLFLGFPAMPAEAQNPKIDAKRFGQEATYHNEMLQLTKKEKSDTLKRGLAKPYALVHPHPGVHALPQDNMPCIVPDMNTVIAIPNGWKGHTQVPFTGRPPKMPNPSKPLIIRPERPLLTYPDGDKTK